MDKVAEIISAAQSLSPEERRELVAALSAFDAEGVESSSVAERGGPEKPFQALRALAGTAHSDHPDLSTEKYLHVADSSLR